MWWIFWISHFIITTVFGIIAVKIGGKLGVCYYLVALLIPLAGFIFSLISMVYEIKNKENDNIDLRGIMNRDEKEQTLITRFNFENKINTVPLEEALLIDTQIVKRRLMLEVLKSDATRYVKQLKIAVHDNDTETSHYAASAMVEVKRKFENIIGELVVKYEKNKSSDEITKELVHTIYRYFKMDLLDKNNKIKYGYILANAAGDLIKRQPTIEGEIYKELMDVLLEIKEFGRASEYGYIYLQNHAFDEEPYVLLMKLFYIQNKKESFLEVFTALRKSPVKLSNNALNTVRYWMGGVEKNVSA